MVKFGRWDVARKKGEGSIGYWEEKKLWVARITVNGKPKKKYGKTQKEVSDWLLETRKAVKDGLPVPSQRLTITQFLERYLEAVESTVRPSTLRSYQNVIRWYIIPELGHIKLSRLEPHHLISLYRKKESEGLSPRTVNYIHGILHRSLQVALKWGYVARNVTELVDAPKLNKKEMKTWTAEQVKQFFVHLQGDRWQALYITACGTALREGELLALKWANVDLEEGKLRVVSTVQFIQGQGLVEGEPKSAKARSSVDLPDFVVESLKVHRSSQDELKSSEKWTENGLVFTTNVGTYIQPRNLVRHFKTKSKEAGLPEIRFHDLRHTVATLLLEKNHHPLLVSELLRHTSITLTLSTYSHILPSLKAGTAKELDDLFK